MARDAYCLACGGIAGQYGKKGARLADYRCARLNGDAPCLGRLSASPLALVPPDKGLANKSGGPYIYVVVTASHSSLRAAQRAWTVPVGRCAS